MQPRQEIADERKESNEPGKTNNPAVPPQTPWYKNVSTLISLVALVLSFGTTYFAYTRAEAQNIQNTRTELRSVLQRLSSLPREYEEGMGKSRGDHNAEGAVSSTLSQENSLLANHAAELARKLPRNSVSATEWYSIAMGLQLDLKYDEAKELLSYALESSKGLAEKVAVLRATADLYFKMGKPSEGRITYQRALEIFSEFSGFDERTKNETQIQTHLGWADSESYIGEASEATEQVAKAKGYLQHLPQDRRTAMVQAMTMGAERNLTVAREPRPKESKSIASNTVRNTPSATPPTKAESKAHHTPKKQQIKKQQTRRSNTNRRKQRCRW